MNCPNCDTPMAEADIIGRDEQIIRTVYDCPNIHCGYHEER